jgi:hypothetical protein
MFAPTEHYLAKIFTAQLVGLAGRGVINGHDSSATGFCSAHTR